MTCGRTAGNRGQGPIEVHVDVLRDEMHRSIGEKKVASAVHTDESGSNASRLTVCINELFLLLSDMFRQKRVVLDESLAGVQRTVELFWADLRDTREHLALPWTVKTMARRCRLGVTAFVHYMKQLANMTPSQYLNRCRTDAAAQLLQKRPEANVTEVAMACGFSSAQYFATVVRRYSGFSSRDFRAATFKDTHK